MEKEGHLMQWTLDMLVPKAVARRALRSAAKGIG